jgi:D-alanyl-D-alanine carboxypeptidase
VLARAVLRVRRLARIVRRRTAVLPFPGRARRLYLTNSNPLLRAGYRGTTGLKTGWTRAAGRCLVATARRRGVHLGVVLLDSPDPGAQARRLLDRGWRARR